MTASQTAVRVGEGEAPAWTVDVDWIAVERALQGDRVSLTRAERTVLWPQLEQRGWSARRIAEVLGVSARQVVRWRAGEVRRMRSYG